VRPAAGRWRSSAAGPRPTRDIETERRRTRRAFLAPLTVVLAGLTIAPFVYNLAISLTDKAATNPETRFVFLRNYADLLTSGDFWSKIKITLIFTVIAVALELALGLAAAIALTRITRGSALLRALFLLPLAAAPVATLFNWRLMLNASFGVVNYVLGLVGLPQPDWTGTPTMALATVIAVDVWMWTPFIVIVLAGGLASVPDELAEAAAVDGAGFWATFRHITLPILTPYILVAVLFRSIDALKTFDSIQLLTAGGPGSSTTTLNYFIYQQGISNLQFGRAAAAATILLVVATILARLLLRWLRSVEA